MVRKYKEVTWTTKVEEFLRGHNDYYTWKQIHEQVGGLPTQISATLSHLSKHHVIEKIIDGANTWYCAMPEEEDNRCRKVQERTPEPIGNRGQRKSSKRTKCGVNDA